MYLDRKSILNKLDNHQKLLSMTSDKVLPIKQVLMNDISEIKNIIEIATRKEK